jgi:ribosomal protein L29
MAHTLTIQELRNMRPADLQKEIAAQRTLVTKMRLGITMNKEKDVAKYRREKQVLARMHTAFTEVQKTSLKSEPAASTVAAPKSAPKKASTAKPKKTAAKSSSKAS